MARYSIIPWTVEAEQLTEPKNVLGVLGQKGDWWVKRDDGYEFLLTDENFRLNYVPCEGERADELLPYLLCAAEGSPEPAD